MLEITVFVPTLYPEICEVLLPSTTAEVQTELASPSEGIAEDRRIRIGLSLA